MTSQEKEKKKFRAFFFFQADKVKNKSISVLPPEQEGQKDSNLPFWTVYEHCINGGGTNKHD